MCGDLCSSNRLLDFCLRIVLRGLCCIGCVWVYVDLALASISQLTAPLEHVVR